MRKSVVGMFLVASACTLLAPSAGAQRRKPPAKPPAGQTTPKPGAAGAGAAGADVELDADAPAGKPGTPGKPVDNSPPPQAGQMTEQAAQAKRLFDGEKWQEAALALDRVRKGETGDDEGN